MEKDDVKTILEAIDNLASLAANGFGRVEGRLDVLEDKVGNLQSNLGLLKVDVKTLQNDVNSLQTKVNEIDQNVVELRNEMTIEVAESSDYKKRVEKLEMRSPFIA